MARSKSYVSRIFLVGEILIFLGIYFFSVNGLPKLSLLRDENMKLEQEIKLLQSEIATLDSEIVAWNTIHFIKKR